MRALWWIHKLLGMAQEMEQEKQKEIQAWLNLEDE